LLSWRGISSKLSDVISAISVIQAPGFAVTMVKPGTITHTTAAGESLFAALPACLIGFMASQVVRFYMHQILKMAGAVNKPLR
jgi:hypothetical protein